MEPRAVTVETQKLYNDIADVIDFQNHKYDQGTWAKNVDYWLDDSGTKYEGNSLGTLSEVVQHQSCNTSGCIAGWATLFSGYHPTVMFHEVDEDRRQSSSFDWLPAFVTSYMTFNYEVMCNTINTETPVLEGIIFGVERAMSMEDIDDRSGIMTYSALRDNDWRVNGDNAKISNLKKYDKKVVFVRPDAIARDLLNLDFDEARIVFDGEAWWTGDNIRSIGKGEDIYDLDGAERCEDCDCYACEC